MNSLRVAILLAIPLFAQVDLRQSEKERALGKHLASDILRESKPLAMPRAQAYVTRIGNELLSHLPGVPYVYSFEVIVTDALEPIPIPGGRIFIPAKFFLSARDEDEFAAMLAHSIGHIALRHGSQKERGVNLPMVFMCGRLGCHADTQGAAMIPPGFLQSQRTFELEADRFGLELMTRAGYDAVAFRRYIERTQLLDTETSPVPTLEVRLAGIDEALRPAPPHVSSAVGEFRGIRETIRSAVAVQRREPTLRH